MIITRRHALALADDLVGWCECRRPAWRRVVLFSGIVLEDVHECATCGKPALDELLAFHTRRREEVA